MLTINTHYRLDNANTMALACTATTAIAITQEEQLEELPPLDSYFILSGGSNVLLPTVLDTTVLLPQMTGICILSDEEDHVIIQVMAGENWHRLVTQCTQKGWYGLENLALIPGLAGAAPVQNIGAYGVQLEDVLVGVRAFDLHERQWHFFDNFACKFGYRDSLFKHQKQLFITCLHLRLHKNPTIINTSYGDLHAHATTLAKTQGLDTPTPLHVMQAVIDIRSSKLPDPALLPNCGSFFKNPIIDMAHYERLKLTYPTLPSYVIDDKYVKVPAGWLIEQANLKGKGISPIFTHDKQALVLTNHAKRLNTTATQEDIKAAQEFIIQTVFSYFGIGLEREPVWVDGFGKF